MSNSTVQYGSKGVIGTQRWMTRNLDVDTYRNGDLIPEVQNQATWESLTTGAWCYYNNDPATGDIYGKLYNWYAVNDPRGLAPFGWHIPSSSELTTLANFLGGLTVAGGKLKATGTTYWSSPNTGATNSSRFNAFGGGYRIVTSNFININALSRFWSSLSIDSTNANYYQLSSNSSIFLTSAGLSSPKINGYSIRVIKD